jgi:hypothetical protein
MAVLTEDLGLFRTAMRDGKGKAKVSSDLGAVVYREQKRIPVCFNRQ